MTCDTIDHKALAESRLITQYREATNFKARVDALIDESDNIEAALCQLLEERWIDTAIGVQLDILGDIVGQPRTVEEIEANVYFGFQSAIGAETFGTLADSGVGGVFRTLADPEYIAKTMDDDEYRVFIKAKVKKNITTTSINNTIEIILSALPTPTGIILTEGEASFHLEFTALLTDSEKLILSNTNFTPKPAGVSVTFSDPDGPFVP